MRTKRSVMVGLLMLSCVVRPVVMASYIRTQTPTRNDDHDEVVDIPRYVWLNTTEPSHAPTKIFKDYVGE